MVQSRIKWKQGDYIKLGRAVSQFNKKINQLQREENKLYLPETLEYSDVKENITTRSELNRIVNSLRRFQRDDASELYETDAGEQITKWERRELGIQVRIAKRRLNKELDTLNEPSIGGFSRVQMGSIEARTIEGRIKSLNKLEKKRGFEFNQLKKSIKFQGASDYEMKKAIVFRENYLEEMKKYSNFTNYEKLEKFLNSINNPIRFFEVVSKNELSGDLTYQSDQYFSQVEFNTFVSELIDEELDEGDSSVNEFMKFKYETATGDEIEL